MHTSYWKHLNQFRIVDKVLVRVCFMLLFLLQRSHKINKVIKTHGSKAAILINLKLLRRRK